MNISNEIWWCHTHRSEATFVCQSGIHRCGPDSVGCLSGPYEISSWTVFAGRNIDDWGNTKSNEPPKEASK